jgi:hypothetical protein
LLPRKNLHVRKASTASSKGRESWTNEEDAETMRNNCVLPPSRRISPAPTSRAVPCTSCCGRSGCCERSEAETGIAGSTFSFHPLLARTARGRAGTSKAPSSDYPPPYRHSPPLPSPSLALLVTSRSTMLDFGLPASLDGLSRSICTYTALYIPTRFSNAFCASCADFCLISACLPSPSPNLVVM